MFLNLKSFTCQTQATKPKRYTVSLIIRVEHRHCREIGSIATGGPLVDDFFSAIPRVCYIGRCGWVRLL